MFVLEICSSSQAISRDAFGLCSRFHSKYINIDIGQLLVLDIGAEGGNIFLFFFISYI